MQEGPIYDVPLIDSLPLAPGRPDGMRQAMPDKEDLDAIKYSHICVVAGYEVLLAHYHNLVSLLRKLDMRRVETHVGTGEPFYLIAIPCDEFAEIELALPPSSSANRGENLHVESDPINGSCDGST